MPTRPHSPHPASRHPAADPSPTGGRPVDAAPPRARHRYEPARARLRVLVRLVELAGGRGRLVGLTRHGGSWRLELATTDGGRLAIVLRGVEGARAVQGVLAGGASLLAELHRERGRLRLRFTVPGAELELVELWAQDWYLVAG